MGFAEWQAGSYSLYRTRLPADRTELGDTIVCTENLSRRGIAFGQPDADGRRGVKARGKVVAVSMGKDFRFHWALKESVGSLAQRATRRLCMESIHEQGAASQIDDPSV